MIIMNKKITAQITAVVTVLTVLVAQSIYYNKKTPLAVQEATSSSDVLHSSSTQSVRYDEKRLIVRTKSKSAFNGIKEIKNVRHFLNDTYIVQVSDLKKVEQILQSHADIISVERNSIQRVGVASTQSLPYFETPSNQQELQDNDLLKSEHFNDPGVSSMWHFRDAKTAGITLDKAYTALKNKTSQEIIVAVVDTGVDINHQELKSVMWVNTNEIPNNNLDDDKNGYIDDINGINTSERDAYGSATNKVMDKHSHGTHVSGIIAAQQNNKKGIAGIASNAKIMALKTVPADSDETDIDVAEAFLYAAKNGAKIINCSFGKRINEGQNLIPDTLQYIADEYGVLVVIAAGNYTQDIDKKPIYPASHKNDNTIVVASTTSSADLSSFSNYGFIGVDVAAPGDSIYSTVLNNKYAMYSGTSMATPVVAGIAAEIWSHYPHLKYNEIKNIIMNSATYSDILKKKVVSEGRADLYNSYLAAEKL